MCIGESFLRGLGRGGGGVGAHTVCRMVLLYALIDVASFSFCLRSPSSPARPPNPQT